MFPTTLISTSHQAASIKGAACFTINLKLSEDEKMDVNTISQLIGSLGFPIACCIYLIYSNNKANETHKQEVDKLRETVENNTRVMLKLCAKLGVDADD